MVETRPSVLVFINLLLFMSSALPGCGESSVPVIVQYNQDVQPLLLAHCVRCHRAGGTLNGDSDIGFGPVASSFATGKPLQGYFDCAADRGDCSSANPTAPTCRRGFRYYANDMPGAIAQVAWLHLMPPPPAPPLTTFESEILYKWLASPDNQSPAVPCAP